MKKILSLALLLGLCACTTIGSDYADYRGQMKEKMKADFSVPQKMLDFHKDIDIPFISITFGEINERFPASPCLEGGPVVKLSKHCSVVMMDLEHKTVRDPAMERYNKNYSIMTTTGWMLHNCGLPWADWYIHDNGGVILAEDEVNRLKQKGYILSEEEREQLIENVNQLRALYEHHWENTKVTRKINCDHLFYSKIPHFDKVSTMIDSEFTDKLKENATECYGVELYKKSIANSIVMLFFINGDKTTIEKSITKMARYISFAP